MAQVIIQVVKLHVRNINYKNDALIKLAGLMIDYTLDASILLEILKLSVNNFLIKI